MMGMRNDKVLSEARLFAICILLDFKSRYSTNYSSQVLLMSHAIPEKLMWETFTSIIDIESLSL